MLSNSSYPALWIANQEHARQVRFMMDYQNTDLWRRSLARRDIDNDAGARERLRVAYSQFWGNAVTLSREIQKSLPGLTLHDEAHFEALWARADQIAGPEFELTPLEAFTFGGAILLHDAANSVAAFPGGRAELEATPEWRDAVTERGFAFGAMLPPETDAVVLLDTLRSLHAHRAETIAGMEVAAGGNRFHLLPDSQLRAHLGGLIGQIAASHHWDVSTLPAKLPHITGSLAGMPASWTVRPVLLACLLRCADATQLDQARAPDFLYGLLQLRGLSEQHWRAQNRLATPLVESDDPHALRFTSTAAFGEEDADAWWIAHDALQVANRELQACDSLLRDLRMRTFAVNRIRGAESPSRLATLVAVRGWRPVSAVVKATRVERIVDMFGGEQLYGRDLSIAVRELIQNAADAVCFRRELEPNGSGYEGSITVGLTPVDDQSNDHWLSVEDDGLGMSEAVLTGPLIDFGSSYLSSALVKAERPGLLSKGRKRIGEFGVGFFSAFMLSNEVSVVSRPFDDGLDRCRTLRFKDGIVVRPLLLDTRPADFAAALSTRVTLRINPERYAELLSNQFGLRQSKVPITLSQLVASLCPMLDVDVFVKESSSRFIVHSRRWMDGDRVAWLRSLRLPDGTARPSEPAELEETATLLRPVDPSDLSAGLAAITGTAIQGVATVGTLRATPSFGTNYRDGFAGAIDHLPAGARRGDGPPRAEALLPEWASEQARLLSKAGIAFPQRQYAAQRVAGFKGDASPIAGMRLNGAWATLEEVFDALVREGALYAPVKADTFTQGHVLLTVARERHSGLLDNYLPGELEPLLPMLEGVDASGPNDLYRVPTGIDEAKYGFIALLQLHAAARNYLIDGEFLDRVEFAKYVGRPSEREGLLPGKVVATTGLKLTSHRLTG